MKRARVEVEGDFNPVYPFDKDDEQDNQDVNSTLPPFLSSNGLTESPAGFLALKTSNPMDFTDKGALTVKTNPPIEVNSSGQLSLKLGSGLTVSGGALQAMGETVSVTAPITKTNGNIGLQLASNPGLQVSNGLKLKVTAPFTLNNNGLNIGVDAPLRIQDNKLQLSTGNGIEVASNRTLAVKLKRTGNNNQGLDFDGVQLVLKLGDGLKLGNTGYVDIRLGNANNCGLQLENGELKFKMGDGLIYGNTGYVDVNVGQGIEINQRKVKVKTAEGLAFDNQNRLKIKCNTPLGFDGTGNLKVGLGDGLYIANDKIFYEAPTLWTTASPQTNANVRSESDNQTTKNAKVQLTLSRCGAMVLGYISVYGTGAPLIPINTGTTTNLRLLLAFDGEGRLVNGNNMLTSSLEVKAGATVNASSGIDRRIFMPNKGSYLNSGSDSGQAHNAIFRKVYLNKDINKTCDLTLTLNENRANGQYSLYFKWTNFSASVNNQTFSTCVTHFVYLGENP
ncbi:fiber [Titi monkey adenovirus ECC-2011]|uniref:Fiber n=1 Tax=titi monkey adenovirus 1 TaxID=3123084 RepID=G0ZAJ9_9ADEN|nr:fiber [Titi monkey adenovirus ECC-2011]AEK98470.1 fiber [Titi monkey adenovirus ECC-2011]